MVIECLLLPNFEMVIRLGISEVMRSSEIIETEAMRGQDQNLEFSEQQAPTWLGIPPGYLLLPRP
jgi:hypothetical protein